MPRSYTKVECLAEKVFRRKEAGETSREISEHFGSRKEQVKQLAIRQRRKQQLTDHAYIPHPKGRPRKDAADEGVRQKRTGATASAGGVAAKFSVRNWEEVKLKYRVIERLRGKYSIQAMCDMLEVPRSDYYACEIGRTNRVKTSGW